jgi:hypothetical protein
MEITVLEFNDKVYSGISMFETWLRWIYAKKRFAIILRSICKKKTKKKQRIFRRNCPADADCGTYAQWGLTKTGNNYGNWDIDQFHNYYAKFPGMALWQMEPILGYSHSIEIRPKYCIVRF